MAQPTTTFLDELMSAARGCFALLVGNRQAPSYFDFSQRGLVGSLIAVLIVMGLTGFGPMLTGVPAPAGVATQSVILSGVLFATQAATAFLALRQMGRQDAFIPYLVASNWIALISSLLVLISGVIGPLGIIVLGLVVILALVTFINIGRFIVTLTGLQIGILFVAEAVGGFLALAVIAVIIGPAPPPV